LSERFCAGNITFMDRLERIAFNSLPAALWEDVTANVYHHSSNQLTCGAWTLVYCIPAPFLFLRECS
jgi:hypothetical protein